MTLRLENVNLNKSHDRAVLAAAKTLCKRVSGSPWTECAEGQQAEFFAMAECAVMAYMRDRFHSPSEFALATAERV